MVVLVYELNIDFEHKNFISNDKGASLQEDITFLNVYAPKIGTPKCIKQILTELRGETDGNTIVGDFSTPFSTIDSSSGQKISKETLDVNYMLDWMVLTDVYRTFHPKEAEYRFFSSTHEIFSRTHPMLGQKTNLNKF